MEYSKQGCMGRPLLRGAPFCRRWRCAISWGGFRGRLFSAALLVVTLAGAGCSTVAVVIPSPLEEVVGTELQAVAIEPDLTEASGPPQPSDSLMHLVNFEYSDPNPVQLVSLAAPPAPELRRETMPVTLDAGLPQSSDPWKSFNSQMHAFNYDYFDRYLMKPVAGGYSEVVGEGERRLIRNVLDNITTPKRFLNSLLQGKFGGAGRELSRFVINSTLGGFGMTDVAKYQFGIEKSDVDFGQTLEVWGWTESRYMLVPFLPPMTLRDGVGFVVDQITSPITYIFPIPFIGALARDTVAYINNRGLRLETDKNLAEPLYGDLQNAYFIQRAELIKAQ